MHSIQHTSSMYDNSIAFNALFYSSLSNTTLLYLLLFNIKVINRSLTNDSREHVGLYIYVLVYKCKDNVLISCVELIDSFFCTMKYYSRYKS